MMQLNKHCNTQCLKPLKKWAKGMKKKCNFHCPILIVTQVFGSSDTALKCKKLAEKNSWEKKPK